MKNGKIKAILTSKVFACAVTGVICLGIGNASAGVGEVQDKLNNEVKVNDKLKNENSKLQKKVDEARPYFEMNEEKKRQEQEQLEQEKAKQQEAQKQKEQQEKQAKEEEEKKGYDTGITYNQLARTPDNYLGKKVKFSGKVIQVMESDGETQIRLAVGDNYDNIILVAIGKSALGGERILENDEITVMGLSAGLITYKSTLGGDITIPSMAADKIQR